MSNPVGTYEHESCGEEVTVELWRPRDFAAHVREEPPHGVTCGAVIVSPDIDYLTGERARYDSEVGMIPAWAEGERHALVAAKLFGVGVLDSRIPGCFWLKAVPEATPEALAEKLREEA